MVSRDEGLAPSSISWMKWRHRGIMNNPFACCYLIDERGNIAAKVAMGVEPILALLLNAGRE